MLKGNEGPSMACCRCGREVWPRVGGYWFLLLSPRGRCRFPGAQEARAVLCSFCGRGLREQIEEGAYAPGSAYEQKAQSGRPRLRAGLSVDGGRDDGGVPGVCGVVGSSRG